MSRDTGVALVPQDVMRRVAKTILPHAALASPAARWVEQSDVDREATRILVHFKYNWRNKYLEWPLDDAPSHPEPIGRWLASVLEALLTLRTGEIAQNPKGAVERYLDRFADEDGSDFVRRFVVPALAGEPQTDVWLEGLPTFAASIATKVPIVGRSVSVVSHSSGREGAS
jgi:hypothetical protein